MGAMLMENWKLISVKVLSLFSITLGSANILANESGANFSPRFSPSIVTDQVTIKFADSLGCPESFDTLISLLKSYLDSSQNLNSRSANLGRQAFDEQLNLNQRTQTQEKLWQLNSFLKQKWLPEFVAFQKLQASKNSTENLIEDYLAQPEHLTPALNRMRKILVDLDVAFASEGGRCEQTDNYEKHFAKLKRIQFEEQIFAKLKLPTNFRDIKMLGEITSLEVNASSHSLVKGAWNIFSQLYQNCSVLSRPTLSATLQLKGIKVTGRHSSGAGDKRELILKDGVPVAEFYANHPYLNDFATYFANEGRANSCVDWTKNAPIYDFGGKPAFRDEKLNLFVNSGSGTSVLGFDCSGFVMGAALVSGRRMIESKANAPTDLLLNYGASAMKSPTGRGLSCLSYFPIQNTAAGLSTLKAGDIMASNSHVIIIEEVGADPFGIKKLTSISQCNVETFQPTQFDIKIIHSSSHNNGVGLARHSAAGIQAETFLTALEELAIKTCKAYFDKSFQASSALASGIHLTRHRNIPSCLEAPLALSNTTCVDKCLFKDF